MNAIKNTLGNVVNGFKVNSIFDIIDQPANETLIAEDLVKAGYTPAMPIDIAAAYQRVLGRSPQQDEMLDTEAYLLSFGLLARG